MYISVYSGTIGNQHFVSYREVSLTHRNTYP